MSTVALLLVIVAAVVIDTAWVALFRAQPVGRFRVVRDGTAIFQFESDVGSFSILPKEGKLHYQLSGDAGTIDKADIRGLEYRANESFAVVQELFFGLDLTDLLPQYRDTVDWLSLSVVTHGGRRVPLFVSGQYHRREFLMTWYIDLQSAVLERLGLLKDVEQQGRDVLDLISRKLGHPRLL
jgi:hypothetical protein